MFLGPDPSPLTLHAKGASSFTYVTRELERRAAWEARRQIAEWRERATGAGHDDSAGDAAKVLHQFREPVQRPVSCIKPPLPPQVRAEMQTMTEKPGSISCAKHSGIKQEHCQRKTPCKKQSTTEEMQAGNGASAAIASISQKKVSNGNKKEKESGGSQNSKLPKLMRIVNAGHERSIVVG